MNIINQLATSCIRPPKQNRKQGIRNNKLGSVFTSVFVLATMYKCMYIIASYQIVLNEGNKMICII